ncbi:MAG: zf-TFIIB domain-containing protein [Polyangiales bacterium]
MSMHHGLAGWLAACGRCGGTWFNNAFCIAIAADEVHWSDRRLIRQASSATAPLRRKGPLHVGCPTCDVPLIANLIDGGIMIDACPDHGTFFDWGELRSYRVERLRQRRLIPSTATRSPNADQIMASVMKRLERLHDTTNAARLRAQKSTSQTTMGAPPVYFPTEREIRASLADFVCPGCKAPTTTLTSSAGLLATCPRCAGAWLDNAASVVLTQGKLLEPDLAFLSHFEGGVATSGASASPFRRASIPRDCPVCAERLVATQTESITTDVCIAHGVFFDAKELGHLHAIYGERAQLKVGDETPTGIAAWLRRTLGLQD